MAELPTGVALDRALVLAPTSLGAIHSRAMVELEEGDMGAARRVIRQVPAEVDQKALAVFFATCQDLYWVLEDSLQALLLTPPPREFDGDLANRALILAQTYHLRGQPGPARAFGDTAQREFALQLEDVPKDGQRHALRGLALGYMGRKAEAIEAVKRGIALAEGIETEIYNTHLLVRVHLLFGEPEQALALLEPLLRKRYVLTPGWLRIDPTFAPLKGNPRFEKLVASG